MFGGHSHIRRGTRGESFLTDFTHCLNFRFDPRPNTPSQFSVRVASRIPEGHLPGCWWNLVDVLWTPAHTPRCVWIKIRAWLYSLLLLTERGSASPSELVAYAVRPRVSMVL